MDGNSSQDRISSRLCDNQSVNLSPVFRFFAVAKNPPTSAGYLRVGGPFGPANETVGKVVFQGQCKILGLIYFSFLNFASHQGMKS
jgi:hypothetical protein